MSIAISICTLMHLLFVASVSMKSLNYFTWPCFSLTLFSFVSCKVLLMLVILALEQFIRTRQSETGDYPPDFLVKQSTQAVILVLAALWELLLGLTELVLFFRSEKRQYYGPLCLPKNDRCSIRGVVHVPVSLVRCLICCHEALHQVGIVSSSTRNDVVSAFILLTELQRVNWIRCSTT